MKQRRGASSRNGVKDRRGAPEIHKFGGASLADAAAIAHATTIIIGRDGPIVVVVSAMAGVTDALLELADSAARGAGDNAQKAVSALRDKYVAAARIALPAGARRDEVVGEIEGSFAELQQLVQGLAILQDLSGRTKDYLVARGERLSARLVAAAVRQAGRKAEYVDALAVIRTDSAYGHAAPDLRRTERAARATLQPLLKQGVIPVVPGYIGATPDGQVATLGRGGSDLTATLLARSLGAREVSLWKDVPGLLTADPRMVPDARVVPQLHVREAAELAYYGAKVLHPRALIPISHRAVAIRIRPFADPASTGTEISRRRTLSAYPVKALTAIPGQALVTVTGAGMLGVPGIAARTFAAVHRAGISVSLISQASSEHSICFSVPEPDATRARASLIHEFKEEIGREEIDGVELQRGAATVVVVGLGMYGTPGIAAQIFGALAGAKINVIAIAQGSSELNVSAVVHAKHAAAALRAIHTAFQLAKIGGGAVDHAERTDVMLLGFGQIGRTLAPMLTRARRNGPPLRVVGVMDRSGFVFDAAGLAPRRLAALAAAKQKGQSLSKTKGGGHRGSAADAVAFAAKHALSNPILVDVTADDTSSTLQAALAAGMHVVLANKRPVAADKGHYDALIAAAEGAKRELRIEATVGAGLPIIDTYLKLAESGDTVSRIEGCPSGTLGYLFGELGRGKKFSVALRGAIAKGYPEPDPREDLSGMDVARKALILGRLLGFPGELKDIKVESLVPKGAEQLTAQEFIARLEEYDEQWRQRVEAARAKGCVLRYRAIVTKRALRVGLVQVDSASPLGSLDGTDNRFIFTTARYRKNPLVITGPGAGPAVTAGGIFNDILRLAGG